jgi:hypothetical protein
MLSLAVAPESIVDEFAAIPLKPESLWQHPCHLGIIPIGEGADGNFAFEQSCRLGAAPMPPQEAKGVGTEAIHSGRADDLQMFIATATDP